MGWVDNAFREAEACKTKMPDLWNQFRDSVGRAVEEFNKHTQGTKHHVDLTDCTARATKYCLRLHKTIDGSSLEVFLDQATRTIKMQQLGGEIKSLCGYRASSDYSYVEFFIGQNRLLDDDVCQVALESFLLRPSPWE